MKTCNNARCNHFVDGECDINALFCEDYINSGRPTTNSFSVKAKLPSLNEVVNVNRTNRYAAAKHKRDVQDVIGYAIMQAKARGEVRPTDKPVILHFTWTEANRKRDVDNVASGKKFVLDAMVEQGIIPNDTQKFVQGFTDTFIVGKEYSVKVEIEEIP